MQVHTFNKQISFKSIYENDHRIPISLKVYLFMKQKNFLYFIKIGQKVLGPCKYIHFTNKNFNK